MPELAVDPTTGQAAQPAPPPDNEEGTVSIKKDEWEGMKKRLDSFESGYRVGQQQTRPVDPPAPSGPSVLDQVKEIDTDIQKLNVEIDEAVSEGKAVSSLLTKRDNLTSKRLRLQIKSEDIDPMMNTGIRTMDALTDEITRGKMAHLSVPEVKQSYEEAIGGLTPDQRINPAMRQAAYNMAVGQNIDKIKEIQREAILREDTQNAATPGSGNGRTQDTGSGDIPKPEDTLSKGALDAIRLKGITVDEYFKKAGHKEGYRGWYKKHYGEEE